jgi:hypothetical protein
MAGMHRALALRIKADFQRNGRIVRRLPEAFQLALIHQWIRLHQRIGARRPGSALLFRRYLS